MIIKVSRAATSLFAVGLIIVALVVLAPFANGAAATTPSPSPSPTTHVTDVGVTVVKEEQITTQKDVTSTHAMTITVTNGNYPADVHLIVLAVSKLGVCEARLIPVGPDGYMEFQTDEDNDSINETLYSELDIDLNAMVAGEVRTLQRAYSLVCSVASPPMNPYEIQADVLPQAPVQEANLGNSPPCPSPWCIPGVAGGPQTASDNVHKNFPHVTIATSEATCVSVPPWPVPPGDTDCDGFASSLEAFMSTDPSRACGTDAWPPDINNSQATNLTDIFLIVEHLNTADIAPGSSPRFDLSGDGNINLTDIFKVSPLLNKSCAS
jgi:hypothetical protein